MARRADKIRTERLLSPFFFLKKKSLRPLCERALARSLQAAHASHTPRAHRETARRPTMNAPPASSSTPVHAPPRPSPRRSSQPQSARKQAKMAPTAHTADFDGFADVQASVTNHYAETQVCAFVRGKTARALMRVAKATQHVAGEEYSAPFTPQESQAAKFGKLTPLGPFLFPGADAFTRDNKKQANWPKCSNPLSCRGPSARLDVAARAT